MVQPPDTSEYHTITLDRSLKKPTSRSFLISKLFVDGLIYVRRTAVLIFFVSFHKDYVLLTRRETGSPHLGFYWMTSCVYNKLIYLFHFFSTDVKYFVLILLLTWKLVFYFISRKKTQSLVSNVFMFIFHLI